jgi:cell division protein FtsB
MAQGARARGGARRVPAGRGGRPAPPRRSSQHERPRLHLGRLALLVLVLVAATFYVSPLRAFFAQQERYQREATTLAAARSENSRMKREIELLNTRSYVTQVARAESKLVPPDTQVFVVRGLPGRAQEDFFASPASHVTEGSFSVLDRVEDLWRTLLR